MVETCMRDVSLTTTRKLGDSHKPLVRVVKKRDQRLCIAALCAIMLQTVSTNRVEKVFFFGYGYLVREVLFPRPHDTFGQGNHVPQI